MSKLQFTTGLRAINLVANPSFEVDDVGWIPVSSGPGRSIDKARFGRASLQIDTNNAAAHEGAYYSVNPNVAQIIHVGSAYVRGAGTIRVRLSDVTNGLDWTSETIQLDDVRWRRLSVSGELGAGVCGDLRLYIETANWQGANITFWVDGAQIEAGTLTDYLDGDMELEIPPHDGEPFYEWYGTRHASRSLRSGRYRLSGRRTTLEQIHSRLSITEVSGLGMPPISLNIQELGTQERTIVQSYRAEPRTIQLTFWAKANKSGYCDEASLMELHEARMNLEDWFKPDRAQDAQPFYMTYIDGDVSISALVHYDSGLEFEGDIRYPWTNSFTVRLVSEEPWWVADTQDSFEIGSHTDINPCDYMLGRLASIWGGVPGGQPNSRVNVIAVAPNGNLWAGGSFTAIGGVAANRVAFYNGTVWDEPDVGIDDGEVWAIAFGPNDLVYIGGDFNQVNGGTTVNNVVAYTPSTDSFSLLDAGGPGLNDAVYGIAVREDEHVFLGGAFTQDNNVPTVLNYITEYDPTGDIFAAIGAGPGLDAPVYTVIMDIDHLLVLMGGMFTDVNGGGGGVMNKVAYWDGAVFGQLGAAAPGRPGGFNDDVLGLAVGPDSRVYAVGEFTGEAAPGGATFNYVAVYNRQWWYPLGDIGDGLFGGSCAWGVCVTKKGEVLIVGDFTSATDCPTATYLAIWDGERFYHFDLVLPAGAMVLAVAERSQDWWIGGDFTGAAIGPALTTVFNSGHRHAFPILDIFGPARLLWWEIMRSSTRIVFDMDVRPGETVHVDLRPGFLKAQSEWRGNMMEGIKPNCDLGGFYFLPHTSQISFLATDTDMHTEIVARWQVVHWSFDDIAWAHGTAS